MKINVGNPMNSLTTVHNFPTTEKDFINLWTALELESLSESQITVESIVTAPHTFDNSLLEGRTFLLEEFNQLSKYLWQLDLDELSIFSQIVTEESSPLEMMNLALNTDKFTIESGTVTQVGEVTTLVTEETFTASSKDFVMASYNLSAPDGTNQIVCLPMHYGELEATLTKLGGDPEVISGDYISSDLYGNNMILEGMFHGTDVSINEICLYQEASLLLDDFKRTNPDWENLESVLIIAKVETFIDLETCINAFPECISHPNITSYKEFALEILSNVDDKISRTQEELEEIGVKALSNENYLFTDGGLLIYEGSYDKMLNLMEQVSQEQDSVFTMEGVT
ncbi:MAG: hypothetical protein R3Y63_14455 [Eubacteriales bacterium]